MRAEGFAEQRLSKAYPYLILTRATSGRARAA
jgi:hypothetical protein